jgi:hypothetical protein
MVEFFLFCAGAAMLFFSFGFALLIAWIVGNFFQKDE